MNYGIKKVTADEYGAELELQNGVTVAINTNKGYLHLSFSGIDYDSRMVCTPMSHPGTEGQDLLISNYVNVFYQPRPGT